MKRLLFFILVLAGLVSCVETLDSLIFVEGVEVTPSNLNLQVGGREQIKATIVPSNATDLTLTWKSSNASVVSVDQDGFVTAHALGTATISAMTSNNISDQCSVTVIPTPANSLEINETGAPSGFESGETFTLTTTIRPSDATNKKVVWTSSHPDIATVRSISDGAAEVTAVRYVGNGRATIVATLGDLRDQVVVQVAMTPVTSIDVLVAVPGEGVVMNNLMMGDTFTLGVAVLPDNATNPDVTWVSSNDDVAVIDEDGVVTVVGAGTVYFTATSDSDTTKVDSSVTYTVRPVVATGVSIDDGDDEDEGDDDYRLLLINGVATFTATVEPARTTDRLRWKVLPASTTAITIEPDEDDPQSITVRAGGDGKADVVAYMVDEAGNNRIIGGKAIADTVRVEVAIPATELWINEGNKAVYVDGQGGQETTTYSVKLEPSNATQTVEWRAEKNPDSDPTGPGYTTEPWVTITPNNQQRTEVTITAAHDGDGTNTIGSQVRLFAFIGESVISQGVVVTVIDTSLAVVPEPEPAP